MEKLNLTKEVKFKLLTIDDVREMLMNSSCLSLISHKHSPTLVGPRVLLKVNTNIGISDKNQINGEIQKLRILSSLSYAPDLMMDCSNISIEKPLWKTMLEEFGHPVGTLPHYVLFNEKTGIDTMALLESIDEMGECGVSFITIHFTATRELYEISRKSRTIPVSSRGGFLTLKDVEINKRDENVFIDNFDTILKIFKKHNMTLSIGTTFRPARIDEALDEVQLKEIIKQRQIVEIIKSNDISILLEGVGHIALKDIPRYCKLVEDINVPLMPLGPLPTDATIGFDHVSSALGATFMSMFGNVGVINSLTRNEHVGGIPSIEMEVEGLKAARVVSHCINIGRFDIMSNIDKSIANSRALRKSCSISGGLFDDNLIPTLENGCSRCGSNCPLRLL